MKKNTCIFSSLVFAALVLTFGSCGGRNGGQETEAEEVVDSLPPLGFWTEDYSCVDGTVKSGETFSGLMTRLGMSQADAYQLAVLCDSTFDVRKLRAGNSYQAYTDSISNELKYIVYSIDRTRQAIFGCADSLSVDIYEKPVEKVKKYGSSAI